MSLIYKICEQTIEVVINQYYIVENSEKITPNLVFSYKYPSLPNIFISWS